MNKPLKEYNLSNSVLDVYSSVKKPKDQRYNTKSRKCYQSKKRKIQICENLWKFVIRKWEKLHKEINENEIQDNKKLL